VLLLGYRPALIAAPVPQAGTSAATSSKSGSEAPAHVKEIYKVDCALCHGANGNGKTDLSTDMKLQLDDWTNPNALSAKTDEQLFSVIRNGKDKMPPEGEGRAKNDDVKGLIHYIRSMSKNTPAAPAAPAATETPAAAAPGPSAN
jgi:mono/diheme cytochrome c family protein